MEKVHIARMVSVTAKIWTTRCAACEFFDRSFLMIIIGMIFIYFITKEFRWISSFLFQHFWWYILFGQHWWWSNYLCSGIIFGTFQGGNYFVIMGWVYFIWRAQIQLVLKKPLSGAGCHLLLPWLFMRGFVQTQFLFVLWNNFWRFSYLNIGLVLELWFRCDVAKSMKRYNSFLKNVWKWIRKWQNVYSKPFLSCCDVFFRAKFGYQHKNGISELVHIIIIFA